MVCDQVRVIEEERNISLSSIMLPWSPDIYQEAELNAAGGFSHPCLAQLISTSIMLIYYSNLDFFGGLVGCATTPAEYRWLSSDSSILSVSNMGVVQAKRPGKATVKVVSIFDNLNFDEVSTVWSLSLLLLILF